MAFAGGDGSTGARGEAAGTPAWMVGLYVLTTLSLLVPLWSVARVPTVDGPCHLYNAWVMRHLHDPAYPLFERHFFVDPAPIPNWLAQALLYVLLGIVAPATAEKLVLTLCLGLFSPGAWAYAGCRGARGRPYAFLALPYAYHVMLHFGFYNFALSLPLCLLALASWWRGRSRPDAWFAVRVNLLLLLCYFAHLVSLAVALMAIGVFWLTGRGDVPARAWWRHPLLLLPQLPLPLLFAAGHPGAIDRWTPGRLWSFLERQRALFYFQSGTYLGTALAALFVLLVAVTIATELRPRVPRHPESSTSPAPFLLAALAVLALYFVAPNAVGEAGWISPRLSLYPFLLVLPALPHALDRRVRAALAIACALLVLNEVRVIARRHREIAREVEAFLAGLQAVEPNTRVLALVWKRADEVERSMVGHAVDYAALEKGLIDFDDYQPWSDLFPVRALPGVAHPRDVEVDPDAFPLLTQAALIDYVYTWGAPKTSPLRWKLSAEYELVTEHDRGELWLRRDLASARP